MAAVERLVNLALLLAARRQPVSADGIRSEGIYPEEQEESAFLRMFERDKDDLRSMGFAIEVDDEGRYRLNTRATFASTVELTFPEAAVIRVVCAALLADPSFPFAEDLRLAVAKISAEAPGGGDFAAVARLADESPDRQGETVASLSAAAASCKRVTFPYTNSLGVSGPHTVEPYGLFVHDGRWYLAGRDTDKNETRTYTVARMGELSVNSARPKSPDFRRPSDFDVSRFVRLPFQYGEPTDEFVAEIRIDAIAAWRAEALSAGQGQLSEADGGALVWRVTARSPMRFARFVLENGPGLTIIQPPGLLAALREGLARTEALHG